MRACIMDESQTKGGGTAFPIDNTYVFYHLLHIHTPRHYKHTQDPNSESRKQEGDKERVHLPRTEIPRRYKLLQ